VIGTLTTSGSYALEKVFRLQGEHFLGWRRDPDDTELKLSSVTFFTDDSSFPEDAIRFPVLMSPRALAQLIEDHCSIVRYGATEFPQLYTVTLDGSSIKGITPSYREIK